MKIFVTNFEIRPLPAAVEQFICRVSRTDFPLHLLPL